ncbi:MAG: NUDIX hydrolase [Selenomonas sp.]|nr:NUDIX hydrolase [Selenomonas sp.]MBF1691231.1 NUDIX hydrolase [Selenomonas sp.]
MYEDLIEHTVRSEDIFDGTLLHVRRDTVRLPNGKEGVREWIRHPGAAAVLPLLPDGNVILVRQYRHPIGKVTLEVPAGKLDAEGEDPLHCARRELSEETGYTAEQYDKLTTIATTVGFSNEYIHLYLARQLSSGRQHTDEDEFVNVVQMPLKEALHLVNTGEIIDAKTIISLMMAAPHCPTES